MTIKNTIISPLSPTTHHISGLQAGVEKANSSSPTQLTGGPGSAGSTAPSIPITRQARANNTNMMLTTCIFAFLNYAFFIDISVFMPSSSSIAWLSPPIWSTSLKLVHRVSLQIYSMCFSTAASHSPCSSSTSMRSVTS